MYTEVFLSGALRGWRLRPRREGVSGAYDRDDNLLAQHRSTFRNGLIYREEFQGEDKKLQWYITYTYSEQYLKVLKTTFSGDGRELEQLEQSCLLYDR